MAVTTNFGWTKPTVSGDSNIWGTILNATIDDIDAKLSPALIYAVLDGGGLPIAVGTKTRVEIPFACTAVRATALADQTGSIVVDVWLSTYASYPPTDANSITSSAPVTIAANSKSQDSALTGWNTVIPAGSVLIFNVDSCSTITQCAITLKAQKT